MASERFDIEVQDRVAKSIRTELAAIGSQATQTYTLVQRLNAELGAGARAAASQAQTAASQASSAASRTAAAQARATAETARATAATARAEAAQAKANIAYLQEEAALNRAVAAEQRAVAAKQRLTQATQQAGASAETEAQKQDRLAAVVERAAQRQQAAAAQSAAAWERARARTAGALAAPIGGGGAIAGVASTDAAMVANTATVTAARTEAAAITAAQARLASGYRMASHDIMGNSMVMRESLVVMRELARGDLRRLPGSLSIIGQQFVTSGKSAGGFATAIFTSLGIIKRSGDVMLEAAAAQAKAVADIVAGQLAAAETAAAAAGAEIELASAQQAAATTANERAAAAARLTAATEAQAVADAEAVVAAEALASAQGAVAETSAASAASMRTSLGVISRYLIIPAIAATAALGALRHEANDDSGLRHFSRSMGYSASEVHKLNDVSVSFGDVAKAIFQVGMERLASAFGISTGDISNAWSTALDWMASVTRAVMAGIYAAVAGMAYGVYNIIHNLGDGQSNDNPITNLVHGYRDAYNSAQGFFDSVVTQSRRNARARQDAMAADMHNAGRQRHGGWDRAKELREINQELDTQISNLGLYGEALERAQRIEQLGKQFREHNAPLTEAETAALRRKIQTVQEGTRVQQAMTAAEEAVNGPQRKYEDGQTALNNLLASGAIGLADYAAQMNLVRRAFDDATDPLAALNRELQRSGELVSSYGRSRDLGEYIQQLQQAAEAQGRSIYQQNFGPAANDNGAIVVTGSRRRLTPEAQTMVDEFQRQQRERETTAAFEAIDPREHERQSPGSTSYILDHYRDMYAEIQRFREEDVRNEEEASRRKQILDQALTTARLTTASSMFGQLAALQNSSIREVAAIGKAAAIAQATIDGINAVQAALKGPPGPPWSFAIAGVTAAMTAANVAKIAGIGFAGGGYTGDGYTNDVAGPVHRREYVFDAVATSRIGVPALDAIRSGRTTPLQGGHSSIGGDTRVSIGSISVKVEGKPDDPAATGREVEKGIRRAVRQLTRDELRSQQRDGGLLSQTALSH